MAAGDTTDVVCQLGSLLPWDKFSIEEGKCFSWKERKHVEKRNDREMCFFFTTYELLPTDFWEAFFQVSSRGCTRKVVIYPIPAETPFSAESASRESGTVAVHGPSMYIMYTLQLLDIIWQYLTYTHLSFIYVIHMHLLSITLVKSSVHFLSLPSVNVQKHFRLNYIYLPWN